MNLQKLFLLANTETKELAAEDTQLHFDLLRKSNEPLLRSQLLPRLRAPYQLKSLTQSSFSPGRIQLSWNDINLTRTGVGQKMVVTIPKPAVQPTKNVGIMIEFNDQIPERPEMAQATGRTRSPNLLLRGRNSIPEIQRAYNHAAETPATSGIPVAKGKVLNFEENPDGTLNVEIEVSERNLEKLNWHFQRNYGAQATAIIEMAPEIVTQLLKEAGNFVRQNNESLVPAEITAAFREGKISENEFIDRGLNTYAVTCFAMPEHLMTNMGRNHKNINFSDSDEALLPAFSEGIALLQKQYRIPGVDDKSSAMIYGIANIEEPRENELETVEKRVDSIRNSKELREVAGEKAPDLAVRIFLNHLQDDTGFGKAEPILLNMPTLGLPGDSEEEEAEREKIQETVFAHNEEQERRGEEVETDTAQAHIDHLLGTEKSRSRAIPLPTSANALNALRQYPGNPQNHMVRRIMTQVLAAAEKSAPPQARDLAKKIRDMFRIGTPSDKLPDLERMATSLSKRLAANWYSGNPADILLRMMIKNPPQGKDLEFIRQKGGHNIASSFMRYTSKHVQNQNPLHPVPNRLVAYALFGIQPNSTIPREALADFAARLNHARNFEPVIFRPTEILIPEEASKATDTINRAFEKEAGSKEVGEAEKAIADITVGIIAGLGTTEDQSWITQISRRSGIQIPTHYRLKGEENLSTRSYLANLAALTVKAEPGNISETSRKLDNVFKPFLSATDNKEPEPIKVSIKLEHIQNTESRIPGAEAFGGLASLNQEETRAVTTDSMLPVVWAKKNNIPYHIEIDQVNIEQLTASESAEVNALLTKAIAATEKELTAATPRGEDLRNQEVSLNMQLALSNARSILKALEEPRDKPQIVTEAIQRLRGNEYTEGLIPNLEKEIGQEQPKPKALEEFLEFKTQLVPRIQAEREDLDNELPALTRLAEQTRQIGIFIKEYNPTKKPTEVQLLDDGTITASRVWLREGVEGKAINMEVFDTMKADLISNPPTSHTQLVERVIAEIQGDLITSAPEEPTKSGNILGAFRTENGVIENSLINAYSRAYGHNGAVRNYGMTAEEPQRKSMRYDGNKADPGTTNKNFGLI